jgi:hypothetical protein
MLQVELDATNGIATLCPQGALSEDDFTDAAKVIDPHIEKSGELKGLIIETESFPGWESFSSFLHHLQFVREHHKKVARIAFVTDSAIGNMAEKVGSHFVSATIRHFAYTEKAEALAWITSPAE